MGLGDRIHNAAERLHGKGKKAAGEVSGSDRMRAEGKARAVRADLKQAGEKIRHAFKRH
ncbi:MULTISPECIES: CsbD family protein [Micrococcaceae]|uniref:CsbD family protein n=1 Tax=Pseudarthrobacter humi TaxID=2952523 RepID=A0ABT1LSW8_9MICC|nr:MULTISPECIES: CsbD family protein [Micrococcaceae]MCP9001548.1 CsbD family protein [Pseudarthrobacter humi]